MCYARTSASTGVAKLFQAEFGCRLLVNFDDAVTGFLGELWRNGEQTATRDEIVHLGQGTLCIADVFCPGVERVAPRTASRIHTVLFDKAQVFVVDVHSPLSHRDVADAIRTGANACVTRHFYQLLADFGGGPGHQHEGAAIARRVNDTAWLGPWNF